MGRGGYNGGSTIIYANGSGWSYDPLGSVSPARRSGKKKPKKVTTASPSPSKKKSKKNAQKKKDKVSKKTKQGLLEHLALSCACCKNVGSEPPKLDVTDPAIATIWSSASDDFLPSFQDKISKSCKQAASILNGYLSQCVVAEGAGKDRPSLPPPLRFVSQSPDFTSKLGGLIAARRKLNQDKAIEVFAGHCLSMERLNRARPEVPQRLLNLFKGSVPEELLEAKINELRLKPAVVIERRTKKASVERRARKVLIRPDDKGSL